MKGTSILARTMLVLVTVFCLIATVSAADRPAKQNRDYSPRAVTGPFPFANVGVNVKIKSATIANDGTITARFSITAPEWPAVRQHLEDLAARYAAGAERRQAAGQHPR